MTCARNNAQSVPQPPPGVQRTGVAPFENLEIDFTDVQSSRGLKYLLVIVGTYSGWVKAFPIRTKQSQEIAKVLLRESVPQISLPSTSHSDNRPAFVADTVQILTKSLNINWKFHTAYRPQSSGKVE